MNNFEKLDILYQTVNLTLSNNSKIQTKLGSLLTILFFVLGIFILIENGKEIFLKRNPFSFQNMLISKDFLDINLNQSTYPIQFSVQDRNGNSINLTNYLDIFVTLINYSSSGIGTETNLENTNLNYSLQHPNLSSSNYQLNDGQNVKISGSWDINNVCYLQFSVTICNNKTNQTCETRDKILDFISENKLNFNFYQPDIFLQLSNFENPINSVTKNIYFFLAKSTKINLFYLRQNQINTDSGIIFSNLNTINFVTVDSFTTDISTLLDSDLAVYKGRFFTTNKTQIINRSYLTLQSLFAQLGGLLNIVYFTFILINQIFTKIKMNLIVLNSVFEEQNTNNRDDQSNSRNEIHSQISGINSKINNFFTNSKNTQENTGKLKILKDRNTDKNPHLAGEIISTPLDLDLASKRKLRNIEITLNYEDIFKYVCCNRCKLEKSKNLKYYEILSKIIDYYSDIINYIKKFEEIEKLKLILLDETQLKIFNNIQSKIRDIDDIKGKNDEGRKREVSELMKNIAINPRNKIDENIRNYLIL